VAAKLRTEVGEDECIDYAVFRIINDALLINGAWGAKAARILADLIDPTCHAVHPDTAADDELVCSECGAYMGAIVPFIGAVLPLYCPSCGARVVEGGEG
jgi:hypothetical protein